MTAPPPTPPNPWPGEPTDAQVNAVQAYMGWRWAMTPSATAVAEMLRIAAEHAPRDTAARLATVEAALEAAIRVADEARDEWDKAPANMKAGKLLIALSDRRLRYRADISAIHAARTALHPTSAENGDG